MPKHKSLLQTHKVRAAGRLRACSHDKAHQIKKGEYVLEVRVGLGWQGYCRGCAQTMFEQARRDLDSSGAQAV